MRGSDRRAGELFSYVDLEKRIRVDHPLRAIRPGGGAGVDERRGGRKPDNPGRRRRSWRRRTLRVDSHTVGSAASSGECGLGSVEILEPDAAAAR